MSKVRIENQLSHEHCCELLKVAEQRILSQKEQAEYEVLYHIDKRLSGLLLGEQVCRSHRASIHISD